MLTLPVGFVATQQLAVEGLHVGNGGQGDKEIAPHVADLVLEVAFLVTGVVAKCNLETVVRLKAQEHLRHPHILADASAYAASVIEDETRRNASDAMEQVLQTMGDAFCRFSTEELYVTGIAVGDANAEEFEHPLRVTSIVEIRLAEVHLCFTRLPVQLECTFLVAVLRLFAKRWTSGYDAS